MLGLVDKMCAKLSLSDMQQEAQVMKEYLKETESVFQTLKDWLTLPAYLSLYISNSSIW